MIPSTLNEIAQAIHDNAVAHGFWEADRNFGEMIALAHAELSESLEAHRDGDRNLYFHAADSNGHCKPDGVAVELVDCIIRCLDTLHSLDVDVDAILSLKMDYNETRPHKHGKAY